jgi:hypothetical protein
VVSVKSHTALSAGYSATPLAKKPLGFVDVKVCAGDAVWSGLKLVVRRELRGTARPRAPSAGVR